MNPVVQKKIYYNKLIRAFYNAVDGKTNIRVDLRQLAAAIQITRENFDTTYSDLIADTLIEQYGMGDHSVAMLTPKGFKYVEDLDLLSEKEILMGTVKYLKPMTGYRSIYDLFDAVGVNEEVDYRGDMLRQLYKLKLIEPANHSELFACISPIGKTVTDSTYDDLFIKTVPVLDYNGKRQMMLETYNSDGKVWLEIELQPKLKGYLTDADIREFIAEFVETKYITHDSKQLWNGGSLMGHHITNKGKEFFKRRRLY